MNRGPASSIAGGDGIATYLTGGTTAKPREIRYDADRWHRSVSVKAEMMRAHGVGRNSRVAVCHPFDPWSIGGIHRDAALLCGAHVLPLGLSAGTPAMLGVLAGFRPDYICATASLTALWLCSAAIPERPITLLHAGEPLSASDREACERMLIKPVVNIYGLAELDAIGCELEPGEGLILAPQFSYRLVGPDNSPIAIEPGASGALQVRESVHARWIPTNDHVVVLDYAPSCSPLWPGSIRVAYGHRLDHAVSLPDGSVISAAQVRAAQSSLASAGIVNLQAQVHRPAGQRAQVRLVAIRRSGSMPRAALVRSQMLAAACDLADAEANGALTLAVCISDGEGLIWTDRGKFSPVVVVEDPAPADLAVAAAPRAQSHELPHG